MTNNVNIHESANQEVLEKVEALTERLDHSVPDQR